MKTGKLTINPAYPYQNCKDEKSYIPVIFSKKKTGNPGAKRCPEDKNCTRLQNSQL